PSAAIDVLLQGVDLLRQIAGASGPKFEGWLTEHGEAVEGMRHRLDAVLTGKAEAVAPAAPPAAAEIATPPPQEPGEPRTEPSGVSCASDPLTPLGSVRGSDSMEPPPA